MDHNQIEIASVIGVHKSTISRELRCNCGQRGYRPKQAHRLAVNRQKKPPYRILPGTWTLIEAKVRLAWSPEQISGWLNKDYDVRVSHEWIYQHILADKRAGGDLHRHLRCQKRRALPSRGIRCWVTWMEVWISPKRCTKSRKC